MKMKVRIEGTDEIARNLKKMGAALRSSTLVPIMVEHLEPMAEDMRAHAARRSGQMSVGCGFVWMALHVLAEPMIEHQLRKAPLPVDMYSRWPELRRPVLVLVVSLLMAAAAVGLR